MKRLFPVLVLVAIAATLLPATAPPAYACTCAPDTSPQDHIAAANIIVIGTVVGLVDGSESSGPIADHDALVSVERYLKGSGPASIVADDPPHGGLCGYFDDASIGKRHVLFLSGDSIPPRTSLCSGNALVGDYVPGQSAPGGVLDAIMAMTGPGSPPDTPADNSDGPWPAVGLWSVLGAAALLAASAYALHRRGRVRAE
jgi:hypothetical protein